MPADVFLDQPLLPAKEKARRFREELLQIQGEHGAFPVHAHDIGHDERHHGVLRLQAQ